jgi:general secretion pathway protein A
MLDLYETFYKLTTDPFRLSPDHRFVLDHRSYAKSRSYLEYALHRGEGFIVITGGAGTGKTTLINEILARLDKTRIQVATLTSAQMESRALLQMVVASFGLPLKEIDKATLLLRLADFLTQQSQKGRRAILVVDEAQGLPPSALEELRLLANLQSNNRLLLQVFLVGQESLRELIGKPDMDHLRQRIVAASHLDPLKPNETVDYVEHRLSLAGWQGDPKIDAEALTLIHKFSGGTPRRINLICSRLLLYGAMEEKHALVGADAKSVIEDLQQEQLMAPVAELRNGATGPTSRAGVRAEEGAMATIESLPRKKKATEDSVSAAQHPLLGQHSETTAADSAQQTSARAVKPEGGDVVESAGNRSIRASFSGRDILREIEQLKQELVDSDDGLEEW